MLDRRCGILRLAVVRVVALVAYVALLLLFFAEHRIEVVAAGRLLNGLLFLVEAV